jgi:hypothetical protein
MLTMETKSQNTIPTGNGNKTLDPGGNNAAKHWISKHPYLLFCILLCYQTLLHFIAAFCYVYTML